MPKYWFNLDMDIVTGDTRTITMTFDVGGVPTPISAWTFYYKAVNRADATKTITVADGAMTKSDSGMGVTDTISIPIDNSVNTEASAPVGKYDHEVAVKIAGEPTVIAKGTLTIVSRQTSVS